PDRQLRVRRGQVRAAGRRQGQCAAGLPALGHHHRERHVLPEGPRLPAAERPAGDARRAADRGDRLMTATLAPPATRPARHAQGAPRRVPRGMARRHGLSTPDTLRALLASLVLLSLAWGAFGGWVATVHSSAAQSLVNVDEPLSLDARQMYQAIA